MADLSPYIGKIDGVPIQLHWSLILMLLAFLYLSVHFFLLWVLLFACVLVHELFHSITAKRNGIAVKKIMLYPLGGGSIIDFENVRPEMEFKISLVGPISSLLLAALFGIAVIYAPLGPMGIIKQTVQWLFLVNLLLAGLNLAPWFPLDGGRTLRSYLQKKRGFYNATKLAVRVSNVVTVLFLIGSVAYAVEVSGTWLQLEFITFVSVFVAMFIYGGAKAEMQSAFIKENTTKLRVADALSRNYVEVKPSTTIAQLYGTMLKHHTHIVLFKDNGAVKVVSNLSFDKLPQRGRALKNIMQLGVEIPQIDYNAPLFNAINRFQLEEKNILAVTRNGGVVGIVLEPHVESVITLYLSHRKGK